MEKKPLNAGSARCTAGPPPLLEELQPSRPPPSVGSCGLCRRRRGSNQEVRSTGRCRQTDDKPLELGEGLELLNHRGRTSSSAARCCPPSDPPPPRKRRRFFFHPPEGWAPWRSEGALGLSCQPPRRAQTLRGGAAAAAPRRAEAAPAAPAAPGPRPELAPSPTRGGAERR